MTDESLSVQVPTLRPVEEWEPGFTVMLAPLDQHAPAHYQIARLAEVAAMDAELAESLLAARTTLPAVRVSSEQEAALVARMLGEADLGATVVADADLDLSRHVRRVREIRPAGDALELLVLWGEWTSIPLEELTVAVEGRVVSTRVELLEGAGKKRGARDLVDSAQYFVETSVIDLYGPSLDASFRIKADSFDFSCLGGRPSPRLDANFAALGDLLRRVVGPSRYDAEFSRVVRLLDHAWPAASRVTSRGLSRKGDFKKYTSSEVTSDALAQFTRYSRTRFLLSRR